MKIDGIILDKVNNKFAKIYKVIHFLFKLKNPASSQFLILLKESHSSTKVIKGIIDNKQRKIEFSQIGINSHQLK